jgi:hypothetical protein
MNAIKLLTTSAAALAVVGAGLVYAQTTTPGSTTTESPSTTQAQPMTTPPAGGMTTPAATPATPSQDTVQRSDTTMAPDAQADRN